MSRLTGLHRLGRRLVPPPVRWKLFSTFLRCRLIRPRGMPDQPDAPVYVVGFLSRVSGVGRVARLYREHFESLGRTVVPIDLATVLSHGSPLPDSEQTDTPITVRRRARRDEPGTILVIMDAPYSPLPLLLLGRRFRRPKRIVAVWFWELARMPSSWSWSARCFDEIWTCSRFNFDAATAVTDRARLVSLPLPKTPTDRPRRFGAGKMRVLYLCNMSANFARKNPLAVVDAFSRAFGDNPAAELVIKLTEGELFPEGLSRLRSAVGALPNGVLIEETWPEAALHDLFERSDIYLSLHRAEGLGEPLLEAIRRGLYVVATGWSGNVEYMKTQTRCRLIPCSLVPVVDPQRVYPESEYWAEPDIAAAAAVLRRIAKSEKMSIATD